jgi:hypothetical protein
MVPSRCARSRHDASRSDNQTIKGNRRAILQVDHSSRPIKRQNVIHHDADVVLRTEERAQRSGDVARRQGRGRHLVEQWLKDMVIGGVDQDDLGIAQEMCSGHDSKAASDYDNASSSHGIK